MQKLYRSPCKINLGLEVLSKREDGFHNINTVFYKLFEPHDELVTDQAENFHFSTNSGNIPNDDNNIVVKALHLCVQTARIELPNIRLHLEKNIPSAAGLGGGSADAATAIKLFSEQCKQLTREEIFSIGKKLGADVPFFLFHSDTAIASEIGDKLHPISFHIPFPIIIIQLRNTYISTAKAYEMLRIKKRPAQTDFEGIFANMKSPHSWQGIITNDFEEIAFALHPILFSLKRSLYDLGAEFALMSGSGSAFYGIYENQEKALLAREKLLTDYRQSQVYLYQSETRT
jgi:4-diphosphocytidyl-2-C-methyl-D-erythritol kinase